MYGLLILLDLLTLLLTPAAFTHCKSLIAIIHLSNRLPPFQGKKVIKPLPLISPSPPPLFINCRLYLHLRINHDCDTSCGLTWYVLSCAGSFDLFLIFSYMTYNFICLSFSTLCSSSLWKIDTITFAKLNTAPPPPRQKSTPSLLSPHPPPSNGIEDLWLN